ncbi:MAG: hypothetical protein A3E01_08350 [Gammaproteobacteria bacterium RIFCSPHIGHO2_12_FULL_63_22]|nr:MAG: hypothetical protein A3E01_08350 [Gammaproteobacteria bacterium RIFCSPHIGHO2_12_FULL_63_22]
MAADFEGSAMALTYLAAPYSHQDPEVRRMRYWSSVMKAAEMMKSGECVFSPIAHTHEIGLMMGDAVNHDFWMQQDREILKHCEKLAVLMLPGWMESSGVSEEISVARAIGIPVEYVEP